MGSKAKRREKENTALHDGENQVRLDYTRPSKEGVETRWKAESLEELEITTILCFFFFQTNVRMYLLPIASSTILGFHLYVVSIQ